MSESKRSPQSSGSASGGGGGASLGVNGTEKEGTSSAGGSSLTEKPSASKEEGKIKGSSEGGSSSSNHHKEAHKPHSSGKGAKRLREKEKAAAAAAAAAAEKEEHRREAANRKMFIEDFWDCSICTFRNKAEAFKCGVCDARKGTSTRKPRINPAQLVVAQQVAQQPKPKRKREQSNKKFKNMDRNSDIQTSITVNGITVVITEFKPKPSSRKRTVSENSNGSSDGAGTVQQSDEEFEPLPSNNLAEKPSP